MKPKVSAFIATSLDGFVARKNDSLDWLDHHPGDSDYGFFAFMETVDALIMGRSTFVNTMKMRKWPYGDIPLIVPSSTLTEADLPVHLKEFVTLSTESPTDLLVKLGGDGIKHVFLDGGRLTQSYLDAGLIDELTVSRLPILIGEGIPLFGSLKEDVYLKELNTKAYKCGLVQSHYQLLNTQSK